MELIDATGDEEMREITKERMSDNVINAEKGENPDYAPKKSHASGEVITEDNRMKELFILSRIVILYKENLMINAPRVVEAMNETGLGKIEKGSKLGTCKHKTITGKNFDGEIFQR